mmetsp:Transcript_34388/g.50001  ORF Transcript_34388/g.50001 Transcript_34388/m.50001 type:complete len:192 (-) Transcript_34388:256-831(-)
MMWHQTLAIIVLCNISNILVNSSSYPCLYPQPDKDFSNSAYEGKWFEIGKIQTAGGAFFERNCVCTELNIDITNDTTGDGIADNDCRYKEVTGPWTNVTGRLYGEGLNQPGRWLEEINGNTVNYTVIAIGKDFAVEYDCGVSAGVTNYCVHVMSKSRTMDEGQFDELIQMAEDMGLNPESIPVKKTLQEGC